MADKAQELSETVMNKGSEWIAATSNYLNGDSYGAVAARVVLISMLIVLVIEILISIYKAWEKYTKGSPWLFKGTKQASKQKIILQDPKLADSSTVLPSENEVDGLEFTYSFWMRIDDWAYKYNMWKHVLHKGNHSSWPLRSPGVFIHPTENKLRVYMNTYTQIGEWADVDNIPLKKWFHVAISVKQRNLDIFINGNLVKRHVLSGLPKQNYGDVYINAFRGFGGLMSNIRYFNHYLSFSELNDIVNTGPSSVMEDITDSSNPPYLAYNWWANAGNNVDLTDVKSQHASLENTDPNSFKQAIAAAAL